MRIPLTTLVTLGSANEERLRVAQLLGTDSTDGFLLRAPSVLAPAPGGARRGAGAALHAGVVAPELLLVRNTALPVSANDGALWAGRGASVLLRGGVAVRLGPAFAVVAPELAYARNLGFQSTPAGFEGQRPARGSFVAPWFTGPYAIDLPVRFGDRPYATITAGQSTVGVEAGPVVVGLSSENQWWGPGERNALVLSNAAEGLAHGYVRTRRPLRTRVGAVEARYILGTPATSLYFAPPAGTGQARTVSGAVATVRLAAEPRVTLGVARVVLTQSDDLLGHAFDVVARNSRLGAGDTLHTRPASDQITSVFARWVVPGAGTEAYGEFARTELPRSLRDFLLAPMHTGAYTLGLAHAFRPRAGHAVRTRLEVTNLEQSRTFTDRPPPPDFYTGRAAPAGFTNRGQPLGAAIGPGSQSQWAAVDYYGPRLLVGVYAERVRYQNDALYRVFLASPIRHDVALGGGLRAGVRARGFDAVATLGISDRLNYLFQNGRSNFLGVGTVDARNVLLGLALTPVARPR